MQKRKNRVRNWEGFNREFWQGYNGDDGEGPVHILWFAKKGTFELENNIVVEIELMTRGHADHYVGYMVRLIHKVNGKLTEHFFRFDDYMSSAMEDRADNRDDYPLGNNICYYVNSEARWYIAIPEFDEIATFQSEVMTYIGEYGEPKPRHA